VRVRVRVHIEPGTVVGALWRGRQVMSLSTTSVFRFANLLAVFVLLVHNLGCLWSVARVHNRSPKPRACSVPVGADVGRGRLLFQFPGAQPSWRRRRQIASV
jgi:hypothetical protein